MKLACEACQAQYSIADERVAGKTFKFRCKRCGHVVVLRGGDPAAPPPDAWHAIVDGAQVGPLTPAELERRRATGELSGTTLVWREGMADWVALGALDAPPGDDDDRAKLRNERNETSVLFTLASLQQLATAPPKPDREEGSGLIDIRALASTWAREPVAEVPLAPALVDPIAMMPSRRADRRVVVAIVAMLAMIVALGAALVIVLVRDGGTAQAAVPVSPAAVPVPMPVLVATPPVAEAPVVAAPRPPPQQQRAIVDPPARRTPKPPAVKPGGRSRRARTPAPPSRARTATTPRRAARRSSHAPRPRRAPRSRTCPTTSIARPSCKA